MSTALEYELSIAVENLSLRQPTAWSVRATDMLTTAIVFESRLSSSLSLTRLVRPGAYLIQLNGNGSELQRRSVAVYQNTEVNLQVKDLPVMLVACYVDGYPTTNVCLEAYGAQIVKKTVHGAMFEIQLLPQSGQSSVCLVARALQLLAMIKIDSALLATDSTRRLILRPAALVQITPTRAPDYDGITQLHFAPAGCKSSASLPTVSLGSTPSLITIPEGGYTLTATMPNGESAPCTFVVDGRPGQPYETLLRAQPEAITALQVEIPGALRRVSVVNESGVPTDANLYVYSTTYYEPKFYFPGASPEASVVFQSRTVKGCGRVPVADPAPGRNLCLIAKADGLVSDYVLLTPLTADAVQLTVRPEAQVVGCASGKYIYLTSKRTQQVRAACLDANGRFVMDALTSGSYEAEVSLSARGPNTPVGTIVVMPGTNQVRLGADVLGSTWALVSFDEIATPATLCIKGLHVPIEKGIGKSARIALPSPLLANDRLQFRHGITTDSYQLQDLSDTSRLEISAGTSEGSVTWETDGYNGACELRIVGRPRASTGTARCISSETVISTKSRSVVCNLLPGSYEAVAKWPKACASAIFAVSPGQTFTVALSAKRSIRLMVQDQYGVPMDRIYISCRFLDSTTHCISEAVGISDGLGICAVSTPDGTCQVQIEALDMPPLSTYLQHKEGMVTYSPGQDNATYVIRLGGK